MVCFTKYYAHWRLLEKNIGGRGLRRVSWLIFGSTQRSAVASRIMRAERENYIQGIWGGALLGLGLGLSQTVA
jgi:hypothetical protein